MDMTDTKTPYPNKGEDLLFLTSDRIREYAELLFFAYRSFTSDPDRILEEYGFGRAHHRAIHFINRRPGLTVTELIETLGITKQSLNRVLRTLIDDGYVKSEIGEQDRRERNLYLTEKGNEFENKLAHSQQKRLREAFMAAGPEDVASFKKVLRLIVDPSLAKLIDKFIDQEMQEE